MASGLALLSSEATYKLYELTPGDLEAEARFFQAVINSGIVAIDTETTGLKWAQGARAFMVTFCASTDEAYFIYKDDDYARKIMSALVSDTIALLFWNAKFDLHMMRETYAFAPGAEQRVEDGMLAQRVLDNLGSAKLKVASQQYVEQFGINADTHEKRVKMWLSEHTETVRIGGKTIKTYEPNYSDVPAALMVPYACLDVVLTLHAWQQQELLLVDGLSATYEEELNTLDTIVQMERVGIPVNVEKLAYWKSIAQSETARALTDFERIAPGVNPASRLQLGKFLYETLGNPIKHRTDGGDPATHAVAIRDLETPEAKDVMMRLARWTTGLNKFLEIEAHIGDDGRIHTSIGQSGARTGRMTSSEPNMQNAVSPRFTIIEEIAYIIGWAAARDVFEAEPGRSLLFVDFAAIEMRIFAHYSQDPALLDIFHNDKDSHRTIAGLMYGKDPVDVSKDQRSFGKRVSFCVPIEGTYALTRTGWKSPQELVPGEDELMGYVDGKMKWTPLRAVNFFEPEPVYHYHNKHRFSAVCNEPHRWLTQTLIRTGTTYEWKDSASRPIDKVNSYQRLLLSAPFEGPHILNITPQEAAIIGWAFTDGSVRPRRVGRISAVLYQKKPKYIAQIRRLLRGVAHSESDGREGTKVFKISVHYWQELAKRSGVQTPYDLEQFVLRLDPKQLRYFCAAGYAAEGLTTKARTQYKFSQNVGPTLRAFQLAFTLVGYRVTVDKPRIGPAGNALHTSLTLSKPTVTTQALRKEYVGDQPVWCPTTDCDSWVMRQNGSIMCTSNTRLYGGGVNRIEESLRDGVGSDEGMVHSECVEALAAFELQPNGSEPIHRQLSRALIAAFGRAVPSAERFMTKATNKVKMRRAQFKVGFVTNLFGRKTSIFPGKEFIATNALIQGTAADVFKKALNRVRDVLAGEDAHLVNVIHDELVIDVNDECIARIVPLIREVMCDFPEFSVPIKVAFSIAPHGKSWAFKSDYIEAISE